MIRDCFERGDQIYDLGPGYEDCNAQLENEHGAGV